MEVNQQKMSYNVEFSIATSDQIEAALCKRLESIRLSRNITQAQLAEEAYCKIWVKSRPQDIAKKE